MVVPCYPAGMLLYWSVYLMFFSPIIKLCPKSIRHVSPKPPRRRGSFQLVADFQLGSYEETGVMDYGFHKVKRWPCSQLHKPHRTKSLWTEQILCQVLSLWMTPPIAVAWVPSAAYSEPLAQQQRICITLHRESSVAKCTQSRRNQQTKGSYHTVLENSHCAAVLITRYYLRIPRMSRWRDFALMRLMERFCTSFVSLWATN